ncbi:hypothetical protein CPT_Saba_021 [Proteus phage Saba]|uniref:Uncharacterized protein n=1 Tax=Proteus phage Saba TaxID=2596672 RepID=A0A5B9N5X3_9CAUD|nr:hypothetical protein JT320_gp21 [Proteus phage Saba]QEG09394.1 hypothetical protein CPT_Saba_021 [Proteus phage Saba]
MSCIRIYNRENICLLTVMCDVNLQASIARAKKHLSSNVTALSGAHYAVIDGHQTEMIIRRHPSKKTFVSFYVDAFTAAAKIDVSAMTGNYSFLMLTRHHTGIKDIESFIDGITNMSAVTLTMRIAESISVQRALCDDHLCEMAAANESHNFISGPIVRESSYIPLHP